MKRVLAVLAGGLLIGAFAAPYAKLPPPSPQEKAAAAAKAEKDAAEKAKAAKELAQAQDKAAANYKKNRPSTSTGSDHAKATAPQQELSRKEAQTEMPTPGQANDHSTPARAPGNPSGR